MIINRDITTKAIPALTSPEILLFTGARQAGKTTILQQLLAELERQGKRCFFLNMEDPEYLQHLNTSPKNLLDIFPFDLKQTNYLFVDEVQYLDNPSNFLKYFYDEYKNIIKIIASGSSAFYIDKKFKDSLAGRKKIFRVHTLSLREFLRFKHEDVLAQKDFAHISLSERDTIGRYYQEFITYGGYPRVVLADVSEKKEILQELGFSYIKKDIFDAHIRQDDKFYQLFKILASNIGQLVNTTELANTLNVSQTAINNYILVMRKSFHISLVRPFGNNIRKELTKMPKVYFSDLGLRNFFVNNFAPLIGRQDSGQILENVVYRQLIEIHDEDSIKFWRTTTQHEVDFIVNESQALEVKANPTQWKERKYRKFFESYPHIPLSIVSLKTSTRDISSHPVREAWEV